MMMCVFRCVRVRVASTALFWRRADDVFEMCGSFAGFRYETHRSGVIECKRLEIQLIRAKELEFQHQSEPASRHAQSGAFISPPPPPSSFSPSSLHPHLPLFLAATHLHLTSHFSSPPPSSSYPRPFFPSTMRRRASHVGSDLSERVWTCLFVSCTR